MKNYLQKTNLLVLALASTLDTSALHAADEAGFKPLFNGKDLTGWDGGKEFWSAKDGTIQGQTTTEHPVKENTFLIWTNGTVGDFELLFSYKIVPNNDSGFGNSGVQYRSKIVKPEYWVVSGYQGDFEAGDKYSGILYEEKGRGILAQRGQQTVIKEADGKTKVEVIGTTGKSEEIQAAIKKEDWNDYIIIANGNHLQHFINGKKTIDVIDEEEAKAAKKGVLALQLHAGKPMTVQFKNIRIKDLTKAEPEKEAPLTKEEKELWEKVSYAVGMSIGDAWKANKVDFDLDEVTQAIKDTTAGKKTKITKEESQKAIEAWQKRIRDQQNAVREKEGAANKKKSADFLAENAKKEGFITTPSGLQYKVVKNGDGKIPTDSDTVSVHYVGTLIDGTVFDSSRKRGQPAQFPVNGVIPGWTEALKMMKVGSKWNLVIPPDKAYGENSPPSIPPNSVLLFEVELLNIEKTPETLSTPPPAQTPPPAGKK